MHDTLRARSSYPLIRPHVGALLGLVGGMTFAVVVFASETVFQLATDLEPRSGHPSTGAWILSYIAPCCLLGTLFGILLALGARTRHPYRSVLAALLVVFVSAIVGVEALERSGWRGSLTARLVVGIGILGAGLALFLLWTRRWNGRLPLVDRGPRWFSDGIVLGGIVAVTLVDRAHTHLFPEPLALSSLAGSLGILAAAMGAALAASFASHGLVLLVRRRGAHESRTKIRRLALGASLVAAPIVILTFVGLTVPGRETSFAVTPPRGVIVIVVDTLRADAVGAYSTVPDSPPTPEIDSIARDGVLFESCTASSNWTLPSFASIFTGVHPTRHGAGANPGPGTSFAPMRDDVPTLAGILSRRGVRTHALVNNTYLLPAFGLDRGFDEYRMLRASPDHQVLSRIRLTLAGSRCLPYAPAEIVASEFRDELGDIVGAGRPFLLLVQFMDPHAPYFDRATGEMHPDRGESLGTPEGIDAARRAYLGEVRHLDRFVGEMRRAIERHDLEATTLLVFTADHGEEFREHGGTGHGRALYEESVRVPLMFAGAGVSGRGRCEPDPVGLVDLMPTLLDWWGIEAPAGLAGRTLLGRLGRMDRGDPASGASDGEEGDPEVRSLLAESCYQAEKKMIRMGRFKLIRNLEGGEPVELYDLVGDPGERRDIASEHARKLDVLRKILDRETAQGTGGKIPAVDELPSLGPEVMERLRRLGYRDSTRM